MRKFLPALLIVLAAAGCLRSASEPIDSPGAAPRNTDTPFPTPFPTLPTNTPFVITQPVEVMVTSIVEVTSTPEPTSEFQVQVADASLADANNNSEQPAVNQEFQPTITPFVANPEEATQYAQATEIIAQATQAAINMTLTAQGPVTPLPTFTPTIDPFLTPMFTATFTSAPVQQGFDCVHEVRAGETLYRLSLRYGVLVQDIARLSNISNIQLIVIGQRLTIPGCGTTGTYPPPTSTNTPDPTQVALGFSAPASTGGTTTTTTQPIVGGTQYTVRQGETLFEIGLRYGVSVDQIMAANPSITDASFILMETTIIIPPSQ